MSEERESFSEIHDSKEAAEYRPISPLAVVSVALAVAAPVALLSTVLWIVPLLTTVVAASAVYSVRRGDRELAGGKLATFALAWSLAFLAAGPSQYVCRYMIVTGEAREIAEQWLRHLQTGEIMLAHQLTYPPFPRPLTAESELARFYERNAEDQAGLEKFQELDLPATIVQRGAGLELRFDGVVEHVHADKTDTVALRFAAEPAGKEADAFYADLLLERRESPATRRGMWHIEGHQLNPIE